MDNIKITEAIKVKYCHFDVKYRILEPLEKYEKAILGIIESNLGEINFNELGTMLGFAIEDNPNNKIKKDVAEIDLFNSYLNEISKYHLINIEKENISITEWGKKAFFENQKSSFFEGEISIPTFFDIVIDNLDEGYCFNDINVQAKLLVEENVIKPWKIDEVIDFGENNIVKDFFKNYQDGKNIVFDYLNQNSRFNSSFINIDFKQVNENLRCSLNNKPLYSLDQLFTTKENSTKREEILLKLELESYLSESKTISIHQLNKFKKFIDWETLLADNRFLWNKDSLNWLIKSGIESKLVTINCDTEILLQDIEKYSEYIDWYELSKKVPSERIIKEYTSHPWDYETVSDNLSLENFKQLFDIIINIESFRMERFYPELDINFINTNFNKLVGIESYLTEIQHPELYFFIENFKESQWDWISISNILDLKYALDNIHQLHNYLDIETIIERTFSDNLQISLAQLKTLIQYIDLSENKFLLNRYSNINLSLEQIQLLDKNNLIYWGDTEAPGFELNINQDWIDNIVNEFILKWSYDDSISFLSQNIKDCSYLNSININWDYNAISRNKYLINDSEFLKENIHKFELESILSVISIDNFCDNIDLFVDKITESNVQEFANLINDKADLKNIKGLEKVLNKESLLDQIKWSTIINNTELKADYLNIEDLITTLQDSKFYPLFSYLLTNSLEIDNILKYDHLNWDWTSITERIIKNEDRFKELKEKYSQSIDWSIVIEKVYDANEILLENNLDTIIELISNSHNENHQNKAWETITKKYPEHLLWNDIENTFNNENYKWNWDYISSSKSIEISINNLEKYANQINWDILSESEIISRFFKYNKRIYSSRKEWKTNVINYLEKFERYWNFKLLSNQSNITSDIEIISAFKDRWDWKILSSSKSKLLVNQDKLSEKTIKKFIDKIDSTELSKRDDITLDFSIIKNLKNLNWDWNKLTLNPALKFDKEALFDEFNDKEFDWYELCKRKDLIFTNQEIQELSDKNLDWDYLSSQSTISSNTIIKLKEKPWNWNKVSSNKDLIFDYDLIKILDSKDIDEWFYIVSSKQLEWDLKTSQIISSKIKNNKHYWRELSKNRNVSFDINNISLIKKYKKNWDWDIITKHRIDINDSSILSEFHKEINWHILSSHQNLKITGTLLNEYKDLLNWKMISSKIPFEEDIIENHKEYIDWETFSRESNFSKKLDFVKKHINYIDIDSIEQNDSIDLEIKSYLDEYLKQNLQKKFVYKLKKQRSNWAGYVYHFTHLTNALEIIKNRQIASRNLALKGSKFSDAAGSVVNRRHDAHDYARFYFRPQTPTQFYNECLGKDYLSDKYDQALNLGLPKCPIPVFFKFSIDEIFKNQFDKCYISNGNLQTNWARIGTVSEMYNLFDFDDVYSTIRSTSDGDWRTYINKSQQEFLIRDQFDFSEIRDYEILVRKKSDLFQLKSLLKDYPNVVQKIRIADYDDDIYLNNNKEIEYNLDGNSVTVSTNYNGNGNRSGYFEMKVEKGAYRINSGQVLSKNGDTIRFYPDINIEFESEPCLKVTFKDQVTNKEPWQIIKYCEESMNANDFHNIDKSNLNILPNYPQSIDELCKIIPSLNKTYNSRVRHYTLKGHTNIVLNQFDKYFANQFTKHERAFFKFFLLVHDIGKPKAFQQGNKDNQYVHSIDIINTIWDKLSSSKIDLLKIQFLLSGDIMGDYFQGITDANSTINLIVEGAKKLNISPSKLFNELIIYYQCDTAAYTIDGGGVKKFLEHLFRYEEGQKIFNKDTGLLRFSEKIEKMYDVLKNEIIKWK